MSAGASMSTAATAAAAAGAVSPRWHPRPAVADSAAVLLAVGDLLHRVDTARRRIPDDDGHTEPAARDGSAPIPSGCHDVHGGSGRSEPAARTGGRAEAASPPAPEQVLADVPLDRVVGQYPPEQVRLVKERVLAGSVLDAEQLGEVAIDFLAEVLAGLLVGDDSAAQVDGLSDRPGVVLRAEVLDPSGQRDEISESRRRRARTSPAAARRACPRTRGSRRAEGCRARIATVRGR